ncbi:uncharacterized protein LOC117119885 [Anneissia japonica]|uniref:uncharacterized protein LOC117119885 n=1 Tax=Anneissia japonica TaxID=1529436 RepID=UPI0014255179|nr:uncharacterized protein LOC117119885 [Anneissia japonica]
MPYQGVGEHQLPKSIVSLFSVTMVHGVILYTLLPTNCHDDFLGLGLGLSSLSVVICEDGISIEEADFMEVVKNYPCLYDKSCREFKNRDTKRAAWKAVGRELGHEHPEALYKTIRDRFTRYLRGLKVPSGSGSVPLSAPYESLRWLTGFIKHRKTVSNDDEEFLEDYHIFSCHVDARKDNTLKWLADLSANNSTPHVHLSRVYW